MLESKWVDMGFDVNFMTLTILKFNFLYIP